MTTKATSPISLDERRQRNKSASAKYRAKKNQKYIEMRTLIASLTKENELLMRQLDNVRDENAKLKSTCDRLRGKMLAEKMLKRFLGNEKPIDISGDEEHESGKKGCLLHFQADTVYEQHLLHNFDNDLDDILEDDTCKQQELEWKPHLYMKKVDSQYEANPDNKVPGKS
ncbi:hypothetical protein DFQ28_004229 [Apophysomyces sp. BC1034]|nr:hypothetical protein DFQ30_005362 [Apophysomyces sp. BC1015]KAG0178530.1 hypothetical protein DFQ29_003343 [Apophysomyces sp. BC1021]KAG0188856.1 hypothetical protein DFQ28_004229 [Apophysomyces sp. BC1034]